MIHFIRSYLGTRKKKQTNKQIMTMMIEWVICFINHSFCISWSCYDISATFNLYMGNRVESWTGKNLIKITLKINNHDQRKQVWSDDVWNFCENVWYEWDLILIRWIIIRWRQVCQKIYVNKFVKCFWVEVMRKSEYCCSWELT